MQVKFQVVLTLLRKWNFPLYDLLQEGSICFIIKRKYPQKRGRIIKTIFCSVKFDRVTVNDRGRLKYGSLQMVRQGCRGLVKYGFHFRSI